MGRLTAFITLSLALAACQSLTTTPVSDSIKITPGVVVLWDSFDSFDSLAPQVTGTRTYEVIETITLSNLGPGEPEKQNLWVALISTIFPYQTVHESEISLGQFTIIQDELGNQYAEFDLSNMGVGKEIIIRIRYMISVYSIETVFTSCSGDLPEIFTQSELHIEASNPQIQELADTLSIDQGTACDQVRSFYEFIGNNLVYSYNGRNWGAQAALGEMGADCTEFSSLMIALSRAKGIPARYLEGILYQDSVNPELARLEHAWLEVFFPGIGWSPVDPTLGRSSITRDDYFGKVPADRFIVTVGRNPSTLRGSSYFSHLYWPGDSTEIVNTSFDWEIKLLQDEYSSD